MNLFSSRSNASNFDLAGNTLRKTSRGFTMVELLIVVGIIGLLSSITLSNITDARKRADDAKRSQELNQVKIALELYALTTNSYPALAQESVGGSGASMFADIENRPVHLAHLTKLNYSTDKKLSRFLSSLLTKETSAQAQDTGCNRFNTLATTLVNSGHLATIPKDPKHSPSQGVCYKAWSNGTSIAVYTYSTDKYTTNETLNKKVGIILARNSEVSIQLASSICTSTVAQNGDPFPVINPTSSGAGFCTGEFIADRVLGVTGGTEVLSDGGVTVSEGSCSDSMYTDQSSCEQQESYCSDGSGMYMDQSSCEYAMCGVGTSDGYCSDSSGTYMDQSSCVNATCGNEGYCSDSQYTDSGSCQSAMCYSSDYCSDGSGTYTDQSSCVNAECGGGGYSEYCSSGYHYDQESCQTDGFSWSSDYQPGTNCGYSWYYGSENNCGHQWTDSNSYNCGYSWSDGSAEDTYSCNYTWYSSPRGVWTP